MRLPVPENKVIFIRFHKELDKMIEKEAEMRGAKKATLVSQIMTAFVSSPFPLSPLSSLFFIKRGRGREKIIGKGMNVTIKKAVDNEIRIRAEKEGMRESDFKASIIYSFIEEGEKNG